MYTYVGGDPINNTDSTGLNPDDPGTWIFPQQQRRWPYMCWDSGDEMVPGVTCFGSQGQTTFGTPAQRNMPVSPTILRDEWHEGLELADQLLRKDPDCAALFGLKGEAGNLPPIAIEVLSRISTSYKFGAIQSAPGSVSSATTNGTGSASISVGNGATMQVNSGVMITVNNIANNASFVSGSVYDWAGTILHELGHAYWYLYGAGTSAIAWDHDPNKTDAQNLAASKANTDKIEQKCK